MPGAMKPDEIERVVLDTVAQELRVKPEQVKPASRLVEDLGAGSLNLVEIAFTLEERLGVQLPEDVGETVKTVADILRVVREIAASRR